MEHMASGRQRGFSLIEMAIVVSIASIAAGITVVNFQTAMKAARVTNAYNTVLETMRRARDEAVTQRRVYVVSFTVPGTVAVNQNTPTGTSLLTSTLPTDVSFDVETGVPTAPTTPMGTPDGFGSAQHAIDFDIGVGGGAATTIYFYPDGSAHDAVGNVNNGVVYIARKTDLLSSRAITLWGTTGRLRGWRLYKNTSGTAYWRQQ
jgi:prepilin-type N-terminal cleavage/methylation domain-containing protein